MKGKLFFVNVNILLVLALFIFSTAFAQTVAPGVSQGDIYEYNYNADWN